MRVVLQHNLNPCASLVNGSQGSIVGFEPFDEMVLPRNTIRTSSCESTIRCFAEHNREQPWPIVRFDDGQVRTIYADCAVNELGVKEPFSILSRTQIPLMAGYAITVHKAQVRELMSHLSSTSDISM
jgi:ATP-dependent DNA helicase PIF1